MDSWRWRIEFTVPPTLSIQEWPQRDTAYTGDRGPNRLLQELREALEEDDRVQRTRVVPVIGSGDQPRQRLLVSAQIVSFEGDMGRREVSEAVTDVVRSVIPSASFIGAEQLFEWRDDA